MVGLWGPCWGPLTLLGAILGSTSQFEPIFEQIRENGADHFGTILALCCVCWCLFGQLLWGPIFSSILGGLSEGQCGQSVVNSSQNRCFHFPKIVTFWTLFGTILAPFWHMLPHLGLQKGASENVSKIDPPKSCSDHAVITRALRVNPPGVP